MAAPRLHELRNADVWRRRIRNLCNGLRLLSRVHDPSHILIDLAINNNGSLSDQFKLRSNGEPPAGWSLKFIDASAGTDITALMNSTGWLSRELGARETVPLQIEASYLGPLPQDYSLFIDGISASDNAKSDRVAIQLRTDFDQDGLPDTWEMGYFSSTSLAEPLGDPDRDDMTNRAEYLAGTNPTDPESLLTITHCGVPAKGQCVIQWTSQNNGYFAIERSTLLPHHFTRTVEHIPATPPLNSYTNRVDPQDSAGFFRVTIEEP